MAEISNSTYLTKNIYLNRYTRQENDLLQVRFSATYANTNPNFVFQNIPDQTTSDKVLLAILHVIDNIICRGTITPPSEFLCQKFSRALLKNTDEGPVIDFSKWNAWKNDISRNKINTYSRDIPRWENTIKNGSGSNGDAAYRFYHELLPAWFERTPVVQLIRPEVSFNEISPKASKSNFLNSEVDFYLEQARLVIEIDGEQHKDQQLHDKNRNKFLMNAGCRVIRIPTSDLSDEESLKKTKAKLQKEIERSGLLEKYKSYESLAKHKDSYHQRKNLDVILRFELLITSLIKHAVLDIDSHNWKISLNDPALQELCIAAYDDIQLWFEHIACMCGYRSKLPALEFSSEADADVVIDFEFNKFWTDEALDKRNVVFVRNDYFENCCYYELQDSEKISYPLIHLEENCEEHLLFFLRNFFGYTQFKDGQRKIICRVLSGKDTIGILPTSSGKSLCYQMAGLLQPGITMTICPLVALIKDQKRNLDRFGINRTTSISSADTAKEKDNSLQMLRNKQISFIWIAPERFQIKNFRKQLYEIGGRRIIKYAVLDEVHCLSEWGHDFRTSYLVLVDTIREFCGKECVLYGLTATASDFVLKDILRTFNISSSSVVTSETMHRPELNFHIINSEPGQRYSSLKSILRELEEKYTEAGSIFEPHGEDSICGIVFAVLAKGDDFGSKQIANQLDHEISGNKKYIRYFNSQINESEDGATKEEIQAMYMSNEVPLLVATKAFGMGINKDNVRYTIHHSLPWSSEAFYQEAGRAGRSSDPCKKESDCYIIYCKEHTDKATLDKLFSKDTPVEEVKSISSSFKADLKPIFYLWGMNNSSIDEEFKRMSAILDELKSGKRSFAFNGQQITPSAKKNIAEIVKQPPQKLTLEKTLYYLSLLGFVKDWIIDYSGSVITVNCDNELAEKDTTSIKNNLYAYIRRYDPDFTLEGTRTDYEIFKQIDTDASPVHRYMKILLKWIEANIVYYRKRSIANMISDIENSEGDGNRLKELIEKRFVIAREESALAKIQNRDMDVKTWFEAVENEDVDVTIAVLQRHVETNQNNPAANYVLSLLQLITNREGAYGLESYLTSSLEVLKDPSDKKSVTDFAIQSAKKSAINEQNLDILGGCLAKAYPEYARYVHKELGDNGSFCEILSKQLSTIRELGGLL